MSGLGAVLLTLAVGLAVAAPAASAQAPINVGAATGSAPSTAVDGDGTAYVAWVGTAAGTVDYCVLPDGATACSPAGALTPVGGWGGSKAQVVIDGDTVVILEQVTVTGGGPSPYPSLGLEEWQAPVGTANFSDVNGGASVASAAFGGSNATTSPLSAVVVPGANTLGVDWFTDGGPPTFDEFPLADPPDCSTLTTPVCPFATLEPASNPDPVGNSGGSVASQTGSNPGVLGVYGTDASAGPLACPDGSGDGAAFVYGSGLQSATNDYNVSPSEPNSAWQVAATPIPADCESAQWAVGGGPSGFGLLQNDGDTAQIVYLPFDQATMSFDKAAVPIAQQTYEDESSVSQDAAGRIYATFNLDGPDGPVALAYSSDGGATWTGPAPLEPDPQFGDTQMSSSVGSDGLGWAAWDDGGSVYALEFDAADSAASVAATVGNAPMGASSGVDLTLKCFAVPCQVSTTVLAAAALHGGQSARAGASALGTGSVQITQHGLQKLAIRLTPAGKRLLANHKGSLAASIHEQTTVGSYTAKTTLAIKIRHGLPATQHTQR